MEEPGISSKKTENNSHHFTREEDEEEGVYGTTSRLNGSICLSDKRVGFFSLNIDVLVTLWNIGSCARDILIWSY